MPHTRPLVVSLQLEEQTQERFEVERRALFPPGRTVVGAHLTLFHALPGGLRADLTRVLREVREPFALEVGAPYSLGRGVAYRLRSPALDAAHRGWQERWRAHLTRQDAQPLRAHVTVQNKVEPDVARRTLADLEDGFEPWTTTGTALRVWRYDYGPWALLEDIPLTG